MNGSLFFSNAGDGTVALDLLAVLTVPYRSVLNHPHAPLYYMFVVGLAQLLVPSSLELALVLVREKESCAIYSILFLAAYQLFMALIIDQIYT